MRRAPSIHLHWAQRRQLLALRDARSTSPRVALRAAIALRASDGLPNDAIARALDTSPATVSLWRRRFLAHGVTGLARDAPRPGRPPLIVGPKLEAVIRTSFPRDQPFGKPVSVRSLAQELGVSKSTVQRIRQTHRTPFARTPVAKRSEGPLEFLDTVTDLVGLFLSPPGRAIAFSTDPRLHAIAPPRSGTRASAVPRPRNPGAELRAFLLRSERETPPMLEIHVLVDPRLLPLPPEVRQWLSRHPRTHLHFLPRDRSGTSLMDRLIDGFSQRRDRSGVSASAHRLKYALKDHMRRQREPLTTFVWTATSGEIRGAEGR